MIVGETGGELLLPNRCCRTNNSSFLVWSLLKPVTNIVEEPCIGTPNPVRKCTLLDVIIVSTVSLVFSTAIPFGPRLRLFCKVSTRPLGSQTLSLNSSGRV
ncbi:hypothetical protein PM082_000968 [Marasmius tenuissimus]|nr:hypothetical protein PM082_000968 [Marasmius tenuissimus]